MSSRYLLPILAGLALMAGPLFAAPRLAEFMADNTETIEDEDGDFSDWIEIQNPDGTAVDLTGYSLTDDPAFPKKWIFPNVSIPAGGHLLVFASGKDRVNPATTLHTNFSLELNGEYLALIAPDGTTKVTEFAPTYPPQETDRSYGSAAPLGNVVPIPPGAQSRRIIPSANIANWNELGFVDASWTPGQTGIGYDNNAAPVDYTSLIGPNGNVGPTMFNQRATCYIRVPFNVTSAGGVFKLTLRMKYDDGFIAYINGTKVAADLDPAVPQFDSAATTARADTEAIVYRDFDITQFRSALVNGANVLAIHGLNQAVGSSDFIIMPELNATVSQTGQPFVTGYFPEPTPGTLNGGTTQGFVKDTHFSVDRGFFSAPFTVAITTNTPNAQIRYTTNGTAPTATTGTVYSVPVAINTSTVLRAAAFIAGWTPSNVDTQTYIFPAAVKAQTETQAGFPANWGHEFDFNTGTLSTTLIADADYEMDPQITNSGTYGPLIIPALTTTLPVISIACDTNAIFGPATGIYSDGRLTDGLEIPASVEFFGPGSGDGFRILCGLRIHGGDAPIEHPKKPFRLYFRKEYGATKLNFPIYPNADVKSYDRLQLRPGGHDGWSVPFGGTARDLAYHGTYSRDQFLRQTEIDQGRLAPEGRYVHVYINGLYWGFYNLHEVPGNDYFQSHLGGKEDDWDVVEQTGIPGYKVVDGNGDAFDVLLNLCTPPTRPTDPLIFDQIQDYLDIDDFSDHMLVMIWAGQNDWMGPVFLGTANASRFFNKNWDSGRLSRGLFQTSFLFSTWDAEISMGSQLISATLGHRIVDFNFTRVGEQGFGGTPGPPAQIYNALRSNTEFRRRFADRLQKHFFNGGAMSIGRNQMRLTGLRNQLMLPIVAESARWGDVNGPNFTRNAEWISEMNWLNNTFMTNRNDIVLSQFRAIGMYPAIDAPEFNQFGGVTDPSFQLEITNPLGTGTIYYTTNGTDPQQPSGAIFTTLVDGTSPAKYWVPTSGTLGDTWKNAPDPANIDIWSNGSAAVGFDQVTTYQPHFSTNVASSMLGVNSSVYVRIPFTIASQAQLNSITALTLRVKSDDGFVAFINGGNSVGSLNAPATPVFNSVATATRTKIDSQIYQNLNVSSNINRLVVGTNYLCIQGMNITTGDGDFLMSAKLLATTGTGTGGIAAGAIAYTNPVTLPQTSVVKARILAGGAWSALTEATFIVGEPASSSNLVISEFNYEPAPPTQQEIAAGYTNDGDFEYVELLNPTASVVELSGVRFTFGIEFDFVNSPIQRLLPGQRVLIVRNSAAFAARHGTGHPIAGEFANESALSNGGERLVLLAGNNQPICDFTYDNNEPWPNPPGNSGLSLVLIRPETLPDHSLPQNWRLSREKGGSPGGDDTFTYAEWLVANGGTGSEFGDRDEDGLGNLLEYGLAGNPSESSQDDLPVVGIGRFTPNGVAGDYLTLTFRRQRGADDVDIHVEFSSNFSTWTANGRLVDAVHNIDGTSTETWRSNTPMSASATQFGRVRVVK